MDKIFDLLILTGETNAIGVSSDKGKQYRMPILAYVIKDTGELVEQKTTLTWSSEQNFHLEKLSIYCIKAIAKTDENLESDAYQKCFTVESIISNNIENEQLLEVLQKYNALIIRHDTELGEFVLEKSFFNTFEGNVIWLGNRCDVYFNCVHDLNNYDVCLHIFKSIYATLAVFDKKVKDFACEQLLMLANEWNEDGNIVITKDDFIDKLLILSCDIFINGSYKVTYSCGEIFFGHVVEVRGNIENGLKSATLAG